MSELNIVELKNWLVDIKQGANNQHDNIENLYSVIQQDGLEEDPVVEALIVSAIQQSFKVKARVAYCLASLKSLEDAPKNTELEKKFHRDRSQLSVANKRIEMLLKHILVAAETSKERVEALQE